jgi:hypothetical protein
MRPVQRRSWTRRGDGGAEKGGNKLEAITRKTIRNGDRERERETDRQREREREKERERVRERERKSEKE